MKVEKMIKIYDLESDFIVSIVNIHISKMKLFIQKERFLLQVLALMKDSLIKYLKISLNESVKHLFYFA